MSEPFERVIVDCVGPLPKTRAGNQFLLTIMCCATRYPEAIPLRNITTKSVTKALIKFFTTFGLPKYLQSDQGSNFTAKLFDHVLKALAIKHQTSSAYHPESQGALERWHQTLKGMLKKYCMDTQADWDEGVPFVLFAIRETTQESLGFSPADLVFGHSVRGPLKVMKREAEYLVKNDMAVHSSSPWSSPCILVPKPDGTSRLCTDYRRVNAVTVPDSYPMPRIDDCVDTIGSAAYVTKLDMLKGYWQVPLTARVSAISASVTPEMFLQYTVMAFGMRSSDVSTSS